MEKTTYKNTAMIAAAGFVTLTMLAGGLTVSAARYGSWFSRNTSTTTQTEYIGIDSAKELALEDAGVKASDATFVERECKLDGRKYEIEFTANGCEYEYEIGATDGKIIEKDVERAKSSDSSSRKWGGWSW